MLLSIKLIWLGGNATLLFPKSLKINIASFARQHDIKIKMAKKWNTRSLQQAIDFSPEGGDSDLDCFRKGISSVEEDEIDKAMLQERQWEMER